jgi:hypothetical protein
VSGKVRLNWPLIAAGGITLVIWLAIWWVEHR